MDNITIRQASPNEVPILQNLNDEIFIDNHTYDPDLRMDWAQSEDGGKKYFSELLNNNNAICLIAEIESKAVGYIAAAPKEISYRNSKYIEIDNMGVSPNYRSFGIGTQLISQCLQIAKEKGYQKVYVNSYFQNKGAIEFYKRKEFSEIDLGLERTI